MTLRSDWLDATTRSHARRGAQLITATTDVGNVAMAATLQAGYRNTGTRLLLSTP